MENQQPKFPEQIEQVRRASFALPSLITIDLSVALNDQRYNIAGNLFYIWAAPTNSEYVQVRFNERNARQVPFYLQTGLQLPFDEFYLTTPAGQTGNIEILIGNEAPEFLKVIDNRSASSDDLTEIREELQGDAAPENWGTEKTVGNAAAVEMIAANVDRKGCMIQSKQANAGLVYIGFDNTVATNKWVAELSAGMAITFDDYRGDLYARASALGQLVGWGEW